MQVWDAEGSGEIAFSADEAGVAELGHIVENSITLAALNSQIIDQPNVTTFLAFVCRHCSARTAMLLMAIVLAAIGCYLKTGASYMRR
ncbi:hypothetical protein HSBAA_00580 [Vreelandella sulfidaeris]|uniref:Uncharacterized protein n=1 Tax=Vreelandella sulfidaeris TaxID=115553 RepID=A0A455TZ72_9GAMM|nr:hypothetical protein HSBAA_00580 [Halomonas sulfidaeris]